MIQESTLCPSPVTDMPFMLNHRGTSLDFSTLKLRSLLFFDVELRSWDSKKFLSYCNIFQHLYVLDLERICFTQPELPDAIGNLIHLKFLVLLGANDFKLPSSIGKLKNLQTLEVSNPGHSSCMLPSQMSNLINLRHLTARYKEHVQLSKLTSLQTLNTFVLITFKIKTLLVFSIFKN